MGKFTKEQLYTLALDRHLAVSANAGAGKTRVLVERYLDILLNDAGNVSDPRKIVAITFTKQAAAEMLGRIIEKIDAMLSQAKNAAERRKFQRIRQRLSYANISTIHSFCINILRDYCIEANLSPNFVEINEIQLHNLRNEAIGEAINDYLENNFEEKYENNFNIKDFLFTQYDYKNIVSYVQQLFLKYDNYENIKNIYEGNEETYLSKIYGEIVPAISKIISDFIDNVDRVKTDGIDKLVEDTVKNKRKNDEEKNEFLFIINGFNQLFNTLKEKYSEFQNENNINVKTRLFVEIIELANEICSIKSGRDFLIVKIFNKVSKNEIYEIIYNDQQLQYFATDYRRFLVGKIFSTDFAAESIKLQFRLSKEIVKIADLANEKIIDIKRNLGAIDFDDMLLLTREVLKNKEIATAVSNNYTHILVDEFQDTNSIQYDIVKSLVPDLSENNSKFIFSPKLFIVGDDKQSIYRFRNADVKIFNKVKEEIQAANEKYLTENAKKKMPIKNEFLFINNKEIALGNLKLSATFRLQPVIAAFVNFVCSYNFRNFENISNISYNDLIAGRDKDFLINYFESKKNITNNDAIELDDSFGSVKFLFDVVDKQESSDANDGDENIDTEIEEIETNGEAKKLANYINYIVNNDNFHIKKELNNSWQNVRPNYSDIAILYRNRTKLYALQTELIKANIPFAVVSGEGFFQKQEIIDLINYLHFLYNSRNDLALLGLLMSPFFSLNQTEIINIVSEDGNSLWEKLKNIHNKSEIPRIKFAFEELDKIMQMAPMLTIPHLIRILLASGNWATSLIDNPAEKQILGNIEKFITLARNYQNRDFTSIADFVHELDTLQKISKEPEATHANTENAVNLMTIHASKGMEFPIVVLYGLNQISRNISLPLTSVKYGLIFQTPKIIYLKDNEISISKNGGKRQNLACILAKNEETKEEKAELMRLLYVAMTRAKDHLILTSTLKIGKNEKLNSINENLKFFLNSLGYDAEKLYNIATKISRKNESEFSMLELDLKLPDYDLKGKKIKIKIEINPEIYDNYEIKNNVEKENYPKIIDNENIYYCEKNRIFSFSEINAFQKMQENDEYYKHGFIKRKLGFENLNLHLNQQNKFTNSIKNELSAIDKGLIFHKLFQHINLWFDGNIYEKKLINIVENELLKTEKNLKNDNIFSIVEKCEIIVKTKLLQKFATKIYSAKMEYELSLPIGENYITGIIDCLIENEDGEFEIWDWKTNQIALDNDLQKLKENYSNQMQLYALFLMYLYPLQKKYIARLLFTEKASTNANNEDWTAEFTFTIVDQPNIINKFSAQIKKMLIHIS